MQNRKSTVESAAGQLAAFREKARRAGEDPEIQAVLERSKHIYRQAADLYDQTMQRAWIYVPAVLMGFRPVSKKEEEA